MKQGNSLVTLVMVMLAMALAGYMGFYIWDTFNDPFTTTYAYSYTVNDSVEADGFFAREEQVLPAQQGILDVSRGEGEKVGAGQTVALVYRDDQARAAQAQQEELAMEVELLQYSIEQSGDVASTARLDEDIIQAVVRLRASAARSDYSDLEDQVMAVKSGVLKRDYTYGSGLSAGQLTAQLAQLKGELAALSSQSAGATTWVRAPVSGTFSNLVDGYEQLLTPASVLQLSPSSLRELAASPVAGEAGATGKLITSNRWYFVAALPLSAADRLRQGGTVTVRFSGDFSQDVPMKVEQIGQAEGNEAAVVLSSDRFLAQTTLLRRQTAELIFESETGLRLPKSALRMVTRETTDPDTSLTTTQDILGVYVITGGRAEFKAVEVITEGTDFYVVRSVAKGKTALRAGDEVVVRGTGMYAGKLLEY